MDKITHAFFDLKFKVEFMSRKGEAFQDLFSSVMERRYPADFQRVRPWGNIGDRKNDGYLKSKRMLFQSYAPNEMTAADAVAKIDEDFKGALPHWKQYFDTWVFTHNSIQGLGPQVLTKLLELDKAYSPLKTVYWGYVELHQEAFHLPERELAALLGPALTQENIVNLGMADLQPVLKQIQLLPADVAQDLRPVPASKLAHNMLSDAVAVLLKAGMTRSPLVRQYFTTQGAQSKRDQLAEAFRSHYAELRTSGLAPDDIFAALQRFAGGPTVQDPQRQAAVLAVLAFFFEECEIYERPGPSQSSGSTS